MADNLEENWCLDDEDIDIEVKKSTKKRKLASPDSNGNKKQKRNEEEMSQISDKESKKSKSKGNKKKEVDVDSVLESDNKQKSTITAVKDSKRAKQLQVTQKNGDTSASTKENKKKSSVKGSKHASCKTQFVNMLESYFADTLSSVEADEIRLEDTDFAAERPAGCSEGDHLCAVASDWSRRVSSSSNTPGSPLMLVICSAALRASKLNSELTLFRTKPCRVIKLFAKHFKLQDHVKQLKTVVHLGIGTTHRMLELIEAEALKLDKLRYVVLDWSWRDAKQRRLADMTEIRDDLMKLFRPHLLPVIRSKQAKLVLL